MILEVQTIPELNGETAPVSFKLGEKVLTVSDILDRWLALDHSYFKVKAEDNAIYILRHDKMTQRWELTLFRRDGTAI